MIYTKFPGHIGSLFYKNTKIIGLKGGWNKIGYQIHLAKSQTFKRNYAASINKSPNTFSSEGSFKSFKKYFKFRYILLGVLGTGSFFYATNSEFHDLTKHLYLTAGRVGVVTKATFKCFYHYKKTLPLQKRLSEEEYTKELSKCHSLCADITLKALEKNGGIYIKLGQHVAAMSYLLPIEWTSAMTPLEDRCPESSLEEIDNLFKTDLKLENGLKDMFDEFEEKPIGTASLAQVHIAKLKKEYGGKRVAVKCQHPSLKEFVPLDIMLTQTVFNLLDVVFPEYPLGWLGDELQSSIYVELNFTNEAENAIKTQKYFNSNKEFLFNTAIKVPDIIDIHKRVLIMEYVRGERLDNAAYIDDNNISRSEVSSCVANIFNNMIFTPGVGIHCDPHGGNIAIRSVHDAEDESYNNPHVLENPKSSKNKKKINGHNFEIILYDHGLYRYPDTQLRRDYAKFWLSLLDNDIPRMKKYAKAFANIDEEEFPLFCAAITGRSIETVMKTNISKSQKSTKEIDEMKSRFLNDNMLVQLMSILSKVPRIVLLILKTNDLTRHLDNTLNNPLGPQRTFLILTQYCAKTIYGEKKEEINGHYRKWSFSWIWKSFQNWILYEKKINQLYVYDFTLWLGNLFHKA